MDWRHSSPSMCLTPPSRDELILKVADYWRDDGGWDWNRLSYWFPRDILELLLPVVVSGEENTDHLAWKHSTHGTFSTKSAYLSIRSQNTQMEESQEDWRLVWKAKGPNR